MLALLLLPILVSGFIVCNKHLEHFYKLYRFEGQYLYLRCAWLGLICFFVATFSALLFNFLVPSYISIGSSKICLDLIHCFSLLLTGVISGEPEKLKQVSWLLVISCFSIVVGYLWALISKAYLIFETDSLINAKLYVMGKVLSDSTLEKKLYFSFIEEKPIMLSLDNNKVYVGVVTELGEPTENKGLVQEIAILPIISGYRDEKDQTVHFNTDYEYVNNDNGDDGIDLSVIIRQDKIISLSWFNFEVYNTLNPETAPLQPT